MKSIKSLLLKAVKNSGNYPIIWVDHPNSILIYYIWMGYESIDCFTQINFECFKNTTRISGENKFILMDYSTFIQQYKRFIHPINPIEFHLNLNGLDSDYFYLIKDEIKAIVSQIKQTCNSLYVYDFYKNHSTDKDWNNKAIASNLNYTEINVDSQRKGGVLFEYLSHIETKMQTFQNYHIKNKKYKNYIVVYQNSYELDWIYSQIKPLCINPIILNKKPLIHQKKQLIRFYQAKESNLFVPEYIFPFIIERENTDICFLNPPKQLKTLKNFFFFNRETNFCKPIDILYSANNLPQKLEVKKELGFFKERHWRRLYYYLSLQSRTLFELSLCMKKPIYKISLMTWIMERKKWIEKRNNRFFPLNRQLFYENLSMFLKNEKEHLIRENKLTVAFHKQNLLNQKHHCPKTKISYHPNKNLDNSEDADRFTNIFLQKNKYNEGGIVLGFFQHPRIHKELKRARDNGQKFSNSFKKIVLKTIIQHFPLQQIDFITQVPSTSMNKITYMGDLMFYLESSLGKPYEELLTCEDKNFQRNQHCFAQRILNVKDGYSIIKTLPVEKYSSLKGQTVLLIDDVVSSGCTIKEICKLLRQNIQLNSIWVFVIGRAGYGS